MSDEYSISNNFQSGKIDADTYRRKMARVAERQESCGRIMVGSGTDTYDPLCELPRGHTGRCKSSAAVSTYEQP